MSDGNLMSFVKSARHLGGMATVRIPASLANELRDLNVDLHGTAEGFFEELLKDLKSKSKQTGKKNV